MPTKLDHARELYARLMGAASRSGNPRLERAFELVPREAFLPPGPWHIYSSYGGRYIETPSADPIHLYQNVLVAIDASKRINNGEPQLHAAWIGAVDPHPGETVSHIGAGNGYYTAILSVMITPGGQVHAYEYEPQLASAAKANLQPFEGVEVITGDATALPLPPSDVIYVNAGLSAPPIQWMEALKPGGRMAFPWRPSEEVKMAVLMTRTDAGFALASLGPAIFIPCVGASSFATASKAPTPREARAVRSAWLTADRKPDDTAIAVFPDMWFSSAPLER